MSSFILYVNDGDGVRAGDAIPVSVTRKHVRNLNLRIHRDGSVVLSVPMGTPAGRAQEFLDGRAAWIRKNVDSHLKRAAVQDLLAGQGASTYPLGGESVEVPDGGKLTLDEVDEIYREELARHLPETVMWMESQVGAHASSWKIRAMATRWGSCTPKTGAIRINARLAAYPPVCLSYVVAHELAHLLEPTHNARFHAIVARAIPNEAEVRARMRKPPVG